MICDSCIHKNTFQYVDSKYPECVGTHCIVKCMSRVMRDNWKIDNLNNMIVTECPEYVKEGE